jgi:putative hydrolase of the HAD superfamily
MSQYYRDKQKIKSFTSKIIGKEIWLKMDRGVLSLLEAEELLYKKFPEDKKILDWFFDNWMKMLTPIEENIYILKSLKQKGYWLYFLSNFIKEAYIYVEGKYDFFKYFR